MIGLRLIVIDLNVERSIFSASSVDLVKFWVIGSIDLGFKNVDLFYSCEGIWALGLCYSIVTQVGTKPNHM